LSLLIFLWSGWLICIFLAEPQSLICFFSLLKHLSRFFDLSFRKEYPGSDCSSIPSDIVSISFEFLNFDASISGSILRFSAAILRHRTDRQKRQSQS
jgi:hypothetical protein